MSLENKSNITDMTHGNPLVHILKFAAPLLVGNIFQQLYSMVDSLVVGNYVGANALAAVGTCNSSCFLFFALTSGLAMGMGIIVAQYFGARRDDLVRKTIANGAYVLVVASIIVGLLAFFMAPLILKALQTPDEIMGDAIVYMRTSAIGILGIALYNGIAAALRALGDSKTPLYFLFVSSVVNIILDLTFVLGLNMGVFGVALATIISQYVSCIACAIYAVCKVSYFKLTKEEWNPEWDIIVNSFKLGVPIALQNSMIAVSMMVLQGVVNGFGAAVMAAYTVVSRVELIVQQPYNSLSNAITNYSGQNMGANKIDRVRRGFKLSVLIALIFSILLLPIAFFGGETIVAFFVKDPEVIRIGAKALQINSTCYFALGMIYVPRAVLNGCGDTGFAMINGITEVTCRIIYSNVLTRIPVIGYWGIWITTCATYITTAIICCLRYFKGKWKLKGIVEEKVNDK